VESSKAGTLFSPLVAFKRKQDDNALLEETIPEFVNKRPNRYRGMLIQELCAEMHSFFRQMNVSALQREQFRVDHLPEMVMRPNDAVRKLTRNQVDFVPLEQVEGRIATTLWVVYPPGIATIVPGERVGERARPMLDYLKMFERSANKFPGFEAEIVGLYRKIEPDGAIRFYTYVAKE
jgi:ornithine decarboxylase